MAASMASARVQRSGLGAGWGAPSALQAHSLELQAHSLESKSDDALGRTGAAAEPPKTDVMVESQQSRQPTFDAAGSRAAPSARPVAVAPLRGPKGDRQSFLGVCRRVLVGRA